MLSLMIKERCRRRGHSWGFDWPLQYGRDARLKAWLVWEHATGRIVHMFPDDLNQHGYNFAEGKARKASEPPHDPAINAVLDMTP